VVTEGEGHFRKKDKNQQGKNNFSFSSTPGQRVRQGGLRTRQKDKATRSILTSVGWGTRRALPVRGQGLGQGPGMGGGNLRGNRRLKAIKKGGPLILFKSSGGGGPPKDSASGEKWGIPLVSENFSLFTRRGKISGEDPSLGGKRCRASQDFISRRGSSIRVRPE